ncbi:unnamed protein product [Protopolystoma xenopodis]|uniref:EF-hand domain-containing protein n=1 Tax=Protopolystoma xenopodis TaxID=117903 RepID=A0A3S5AH93_9PLAT|nr:unnamed protein product [Protopolystoma xenopodis]
MFRSAGDNAAHRFTSANVEQVRADEERLDLSLVVAWLRTEPSVIVWLSVLHRVASTEQVVHHARCGVCHQHPMIGFR